jgi:hypothetical protein
MVKWLTEAELEVLDEVLARVAHGRGEHGVPRVGSLRAADRAVGPRLPRAGMSWAIGMTSVAASNALQLEQSARVSDVFFLMSPPSKRTKLC